MFEITIKGDTLEEFHANLQHLAAQFGGVPTSAPKPRRTKAAAETQAETTGDEEESDEQLQRELNEPAEPMPETAKQVVDAGTGKPASATVKMTKDDVRTAAAKLAAKDQAKLAEILGTYGAAKLSEVPADKLGDFASDVVEALS